MRKRQAVFGGNRAIATIAMGVGFLVATLGATPARDVSREILMMVRSDVVSVPEGQGRVEVTPSAVRSSHLRRILAQFGVTGVERALKQRRELSSKLAARGRVRRVPTNWSNFFRITLPRGEDRSAAVDSLNACRDGIVFAEPNAISVPCGSSVYPNDPEFRVGHQYGLWNYGQVGNSNADVRGPEAWSITTGNATEKIAIIDRGVDWTHEDLAAKIVDNPFVINSSHGTQVAGVAAAATNNGLGIAGMDWLARIHPEAMPAEADEADYVNATHNALAFGCRTLSYTTTFPAGVHPISVRLALADAYDLDAVAVAAVGDNGQSVDLTPARYQQGVIAVGASNGNDTQATFSNTGGHLDVVAPGQNITVCNPGSPQYVNASGTSFSAPLVAGIASLLRAFSPTLWNDDVENIIRYSADDLGTTGWDPVYGMGRANARKALDFIRPPNRLIHGWEQPNGTPAGTVTFTDMRFYGVPGLPDGWSYRGTRQEMRRTITFPQPYPASIQPVAWGRGEPTLGFSTENPNPGLGWCDVIPELTTQSSFTLRTYVYDLTDNAFNVHKGWYPCDPSQVQMFWTMVEKHTAPAPALSFFVPEKGSVSSPTVGAAALDVFRMCPNNDGGGLLNNARIKIVLKDLGGNPVVGIPAPDIYVQFNGGTAAQGFVGDGADSIVANSAWNASHGCPTVLSIFADDSTNADGVTYITFKGSTLGYPGVATRDPNRKWGHYDTELPVFVRGEKLAGRLIESDTNGSYTLMIKNIDWTGGLGAEVGEQVTGEDFNGVANTLYETGPLSYWKDFDSNGEVGISDFNLVSNHVGHDCNTPSDP